MRHRNQTCATLLHCAISSVLLSCGQDAEEVEPRFHGLPPIQWSGTYLEFGTDVDGEICPATLPTEDAYMEAVLEHVRSDSTYPIAFYRLSDELREYGFGCPEGSYGCVGHDDDGAVVVGSKILSLRHELIHASSVHGQHRLLEEGLAVFLGTDLRQYGIADPFDIRAAFDSVDNSRRVLPPEFYPEAGHFISYLVQEYGLPAVVSLIEASAAGMTLDELAELSVEHLGVDLHLAIDDYEVAGPGCEVAQYSPTWFQCEFVPPSIPIFTCGAAGTPLTIDVSLDCNDGASGVDNGKIWRDVLFDAPRAVNGLVYLYEGHPVELIVRSCGAGCSQSFVRMSSEVAGEEYINESFQIHEGLNLVRIIQPVESSGRVRFTVNLSCP